VNKLIQRVRDPVHNLIEFNTNDQLERAAWTVIQSRPFQRLRRVKQLGFSELVYPGATHTRFAHSIGVFHTAREMMKIVRSNAGTNHSRETIALAAALVHDLGHGPFSHAFETVGKRLKLRLADHEQMSDLLIRSGEVAEILTDLGGGFANDVADMIKKDGKQTLHNAVVSSQFDADRLDYMRRDRLMTGSQHAAIDFTWLIANLEIGEVTVGVDDTKLGTVPTFVIGPKAVQAAEAYVLGLFQLYPTIYFHKATRGAEKLFAELLVRLVQLVKEDSLAKVGLPANHPLVKFALDPEQIETALSLDDTVVWGALPLLREASDPLINEFSRRLFTRELFKCFDVRALVSHQLDPHNQREEGISATIDRCCADVLLKLEDWNKEKSGDVPLLLTDQAERTPYKAGGGSSGQTEQINVRTDGGALIDLKQRSEVVAALSPFKLTRVYHSRSDTKTATAIGQIVSEEVQRCLVS
jgi:uncharacterized protein